MRRALAAVLAALAPPGAAAAAATTPAAATAATATVVTFLHWEVIVIQRGRRVVHRVAVGGTFTLCASQRLHELEAFFKTRGPSSRGDIELWYLDGRLRDRFVDNPPQSPLGPAGSFAVLSRRGRLPSGEWRLVIRYGGRRVGAAAIDVAAKPGC
jgi:hypothetical protein